jgi:diadenosine tetraphosphatase ApaH/serine/threonine PP2A family protein phosphatase
MFENHEFVGGPDQPEPDVVGYADIHQPFILSFQGKTLFNTGSVGNSLDITESSYVILEGAYGSQDRGSFSVHFIRVPYDIEEAVRQAKESGMPFLEELVRELRTAKYRGRKD